MQTQFFAIAILMLLGAMSPGPDFACVTKNTLLYSRSAGMFTALGVGCAILIHITYCSLGLAVVISQSLLLFNLIKYVGAAYLIYLGTSSLLSARGKHTIGSNKMLNKSTMSNATAYRQGFLCNLLNPKATLFFLAFFTVIIKPDTSTFLMLSYAIEMFVIVTGWFCTLALILSHRNVTRWLERAEKYITKTLSIFLIGFGVVLALVKK